MYEKDIDDTIEPEECFDCKNNVLVNKETAEELLVFMSHQFVNHKYTKVHELIKRLEEFVGGQ